MLKKVTALFLVLLLSSTSFPVMASAAEVGSLNNFQIINSYCEFQSNGVPVPEERCAHSNANGVAVPF